MSRLLIPDQSEPFMRDGRMSQFWYKFLDRLTNSYNATVDNLTTVEGSILGVASVTDVRAATPNKAFHTGLIESASAYVALTDAATVAVDWDTGINFSVTVAGNRTIGNPTNGQPGTYRSILVQGNNGTLRTLTFGSNYKGALPSALTDITSTKWYELTVKCITTSHFTVTAQQAL